MMYYHRLLTLNRKSRCATRGEISHCGLRIIDAKRQKTLNYLKKWASRGFPIRRAYDISEGGKTLSRFDCHHSAYLRLVISQFT
jgi:hypothetical protein